MVKSYKFKIKVSRAVEYKLEQTLKLCRELYNSALQERRDAWEINRVSVNYHTQRAQLPEIKLIRPEIRGVYSQILQDVLRRISKTFDAFFRRIQCGEKAGYPRFKSENRYVSFSYVQSGFKLVGNRLVLSKIGTVKLHLSRQIKGTIKNCTLKREVFGWFVIFAVENEPEKLPHCDKAVGIDIGLENFATYTGDKEPTPNPRFFERLQKKLRVKQRIVARRKKGSNRRRKAVIALRKVYEKIRNCRDDFSHKLSTEIVREHGLIAVENLNIKGLARGFLAKQILDASWSTFLYKLQYKAENAGRNFQKVDARNTSQTCICGTAVRKKLSIRWHRCPNCGLSAHRDSVSAQVILSRVGLNPSGANVTQ